MSFTGDSFTQVTVLHIGSFLHKSKNNFIKFCFITHHLYPRSVAFFIIFFFILIFFFTLVQKWPSVQNCHWCKIFTRETHAILTRSFFWCLFLIWSVVYIVCSIYINCISKQEQFFFEKIKAALFWLAQ